MDFKVEFEMNPQAQGAATSGVKVRFEIGNDNSVVVSGSANGRQFDAILPLQKRNEQIDSEFARTEECWINGKWYNPCPTELPPQEEQGAAQGSNETKSD